MSATRATLTPHAQECVEGYARAVDDEYAAIELHNLAAKASADYDREHRDALENEERLIVATSARLLRAAEIAAMARAAMSKEERRACIKLTDFAAAGLVTEDGIRDNYGTDRYGYYRATRVVLAALADD